MASRSALADVMVTISVPAGLPDRARRRSAARTDDLLFLAATGLAAGAARLDCEGGEDFRSFSCLGWRCRLKIAALSPSAGSVAIGVLTAASAVP